MGDGVRLNVRSSLDYEIYCRAQRCLLQEKKKWPEMHWLDLAQILLVSLVWKVFDLSENKNPLQQNFFVLSENFLVLPLAQYRLLLQLKRSSVKQRTSLWQPRSLYIVLTLFCRSEDNFLQPYHRAENTAAKSKMSAHKVWLWENCSDKKQIHSLFWYCTGICCPFHYFPSYFP